MFHLAMGWNCSVHVSFRNVLESLRPCFVSQWAGIAPPMFHFAMGWNCSAHVSFRNGRELLRPCFVLLVLDGTFVSLFNVVLVARLDIFHRSSRADHVPVPLARRDRPHPATAGGGMCARRHKFVPHPAHRDRSEPSTSPCHSRDATTPRDRRINLCLMTQHIASARQCEFLSFAVDWILQPILSGLCVLKMWLGLPSYLYFSVAWSSKLFVFRCGLEFRAQQ